MFDNVGGRTLSELFIFIGIGEWIVLLLYIQKGIYKAQTLT